MPDALAEDAPDRVSSPGTGPAFAEADAVIVAKGSVPDADPADSWLVQLRWVAITGMVSTVLVAQSVVPELDVLPIALVLGAIIVLNVVWWLLARRERRASGYVVPQIAGDVASLTLVLWFAGGLTNPFANFMAFQVALAGLLCTPRATLGIGLLTMAGLAVLGWAAPLPNVSPAYELLARAMSLISLIGFLAIVVAVYARRLGRLRQESSRNEKLATLGRLVGSMSHELNTPLATILLTARDLREFGPSLDHQEEQALVETIVQEAERAHEIIGLVRGHISPDQQLQYVDLADFVHDVADAELDRLEFVGARRYQLERPCRARVAPAALTQVLVNLLKNATEATALGRRRRVAVSLRKVESVAEISVEDRGPGFAPEILARLGEPFQTTKDASGGTGLGLYVSATIAARMGWTLRVQSVSGGGARVTVSIDGGTEPPHT